MLLVFGANPALDRTLTVPGFRSAEVTRIQAIHEAAGGKGPNVVRVAQTLSVPVRYVAPLGGRTGERIAALAAAEGFDCRWARLTTGETRTCQIVIDPAAADTLVINEQGPQITPADWTALAQLALNEARAAKLFAVSGSLPPGATVADFSALLHDVLALGTPVAVDISGAMLAAALDLPLALLKVNASELGAALGRPLNSVAAVLAAAHDVLRRGPQMLAVTLGKDGALAVDASGAWHACPPAIHAISPTGSGDAFLAGFAAELLNGGGSAAALRLGVACGTANALNIGGGIVHLDDVQRLRDGTTLEQL